MKEHSIRRTVTTERKFNYISEDTGANLSFTLELTEEELKAFRELLRHAASEVDEALEEVLEKKDQ